jgi:hypothetical protein
LIPPNLIIGSKRLKHKEDRYDCPTGSQARLSGVS